MLSWTEGSLTMQEAAFAIENDCTNLISKIPVNSPHLVDRNTGGRASRLEGRANLAAENSTQSHHSTLIVAGDTRI